MPVVGFNKRVFAIAGAALFAASILSAHRVASQPAPKKPPEQAYEPTEYQSGKDVVWLPTAQGLVDKMLDMAKVTKDDTVMDLGSGDGRTVITAAKRGATAIGIEYNPDMVELSRKNAAKEGVSDKATFMKADIFETDFSKATVITLFLLPDLNVRLRPKILAMKPGTRVVSNSFDMGDWLPEQTAEAPAGCTRYCKAYLWIVPERVEGKWKTADGGTIEFKQKYQTVAGNIANGNVVAAIKQGKINHDKIGFTAGDGAEYSAKITGDVMEGTVKTKDGEKPFKAERVKG
ncbi:MAG: class I SAM-dependent methyltransferase [Beijerinckiaceae bacterium]